MDFELSEPEKKFRDEVRAWLKANKPRENGSAEEGAGRAQGAPSDSGWKEDLMSLLAEMADLYEAGRAVGVTRP